MLVQGVLHHVQLARLTFEEAVRLLGLNLCAGRRLFDVSQMVREQLVAKIRDIFLAAAICADDQAECGEER